MKTRLILLLWIIAILLPIGWLSSASPATDRLYRFLFNSGPVHVLAHLMLFGGLAFLLAYALLNQPAPPRSICNRPRPIGRFKTFSRLLLRQHRAKATTKSMASSHFKALTYPTRPVSSNTSSPIPAGPLDRGLSDALRAAFSGDDPARVLTQIQQYAQDYVACISQSSARDEEHIDACAKQADPGYTTFRELVEEQ